MNELKHLNRYFFRYKYRFGLGVIFVIASNLFSVFPAKSVQRAIDELSAMLRNRAAHPIDEVTHVVLVCTALVLLFALIRGAFLFLMRQTLIVMSRKIEYDLKNELFTHYQTLDQSFYRRNNTGDLMARITEDVSRVRMYIGPAIMYFTNLVATFIVVIPAMYGVSPKLATYVLIPLPILSFCIFYVNTIINKRSDAIQQQLSTITSFAQEAFNGIRIIKAYGAERNTSAVLERLTGVYRQRSMSLAKVDATFFPVMMFLTGMSTIITIFVGGMMVIRHELTIGNIAEYIFYVNLLVWPVAALGYTTSLIQRAAVSQRRLNEFLQTRSSLTEGAYLLQGIPSEIRFDHVSYTYEGKSIPAVKDISFVIRKGTTVGILGATGSGKSTIAQLLLRMMDPQQGTIRLDEHLLPSIQLASYRNDIGYVPQDVFLFSDTVRNNILFGNRSDQVNETLLSEVIRDAGLTDTINELSEGMETMIGERGVMLSGGQKQRVSIARALYRNPSVLIFDDCLSAVDTRTESFILDRLSQWNRNRTMVMISHRVSTLRNCDFLMVLEQGEIVEHGTYQELMDTGGRFKQLVEKQMADDIESVA